MPSEIELFPWVVGRLQKAVFFAVTQFRIGPGTYLLDFDSSSFTQGSIGATLTVMQFTWGSKTDEHLCDAMTDEAEKCMQAFVAFEAFAKMQITGLEVARHANNSYFSVLQHIYEFYLAAFVRQHRDTNWTKGFVTKTHKKHFVLDGAFAAEGKRQVDRRLMGIKTGTAPVWENAASYYQALKRLFVVGGVFSPQFGTDFRKARNNLHVSHLRRDLNLTGFYEKYHGVVWLLYCDVVAWKGQNASTIGSQFSILGGIKLP